MIKRIESISGFFNTTAGQIVLGVKSGVMEAKHWNEMFTKSKQQIVQWHVLKDFG